MTYHDRIARLERLVKDFNKKICCLQDEIGNGGGEAFALFTENSPTVALSGAGTELDPLIADSLVVPTQQNGIVSGGEVTWISGYTYSVSPASYYINGVLYNSPYTEITLDPADPLLNRIDVFALTSSGTAVDITGVPSANPEQPSIDTATQLITSFALVVANTTAPSPAVTQEYIYRENLGPAAEWTATGSATIVVNSLNNPSAGTTTIEGTNVVAGATLTFVDATPTTIGASKNVLIFYIRSKAAWNNNRRLNFQFRNGVTNVGISVALGNGLYGFDSTITGFYQRIVLPLSDFAIIPSDTVDRLIVTASGNGGTLGFYIDDVELQGANLPNAPTGTTDNIGIFYVNRNYSGIGAAIVTGTTFASITSTNGGYNTQLMAARMGDMNKAYPDPWAARNAAMDAILAGTITKAYIRVLGGSQYTVGNSNPASNGSATGLPLVATVADVGFSAGTNTSSLMKNNIFYYFEENTSLKYINKVLGLHIGYNVDATHTTFKSGIFGNGTFHHVYGNLEGLSNRFIEINNTRASIQFEADEVALQRVGVWVFSHKQVHLKVRRWYADAQTHGIAINATTDANEGDGQFISVVADIDNVYQGFKYYPYPSGQTHVVNAYRPFFHPDVNNCVRPKFIHFKVKNFISSVGELPTVCGRFLAPNNNATSNRHFVLEIDNLYQETDTAIQAIQSVYGPMINTAAGSGNSVRSNCSETYIIKNANINNALFGLETIYHSNAANKNNNVDIILGNVVRRGVTVGNSYDAIFTLPYAPNASSNAVVGEKPIFNISVGKVIAEQGKIFNNYFPALPVYIASTTIKGTYITKDGSPIMQFTGTGAACILENCTLIAKGAATETIQVNNGANPVSFYSKEANANLPYETGITQQGTLTVDPNLANYF